MNILLLSPYPEALRDIIEAAGDGVSVSNDPIEQALAAAPAPQWIVSYGYRHIIRGAALERFAGRIINLHIAYLPWNRGADPNFWSWYDDTPKGVTIHLIDHGIDTGAILARESVTFPDGATLESSYLVLRTAMEDLFRNAWPRLRTGAHDSIRSDEAGSAHRAADRERVWPLLSAGWQTPVAEVAALGRRKRAEAAD